MQGPVAALLDGGARLHLQHGPIDLLITADADPDARARAFHVARDRFASVLAELVAELPALRTPMSAGTPPPQGAVALRMDHATRPYTGVFVTRMAAVAGAVADEILAAMRAAAPLRRAFVNNGGDIALRLAPGETCRGAMAGVTGADLGRVTVAASDGIGGIATSGSGGRSLSFGIADSVTVLARTAAGADVAATLIANAVDLPAHPGIERRPADQLYPDSDLGPRLVVTAVPRLSAEERRIALQAGSARAQDWLAAGRISGAALFLQGEQIVIGGQMTAATREVLTQDASG